MRSRWLSTFTIIGVLLIGLGVVALVVTNSGHKFVFDPGQTETGQEPIYYIVVGVLMVINGFVTPAPDIDGDAESGEDVAPARSRSAAIRKDVASAVDPSVID